MRDEIIKLKDKLAIAKLGGGLERIEKQHQKGKLSARERIELLLDETILHESTNEQRVYGFLLQIFYYLIGFLLIIDQQKPYHLSLLKALVKRRIDYILHSLSSIVSEQRYLPGECRLPRLIYHPQNIHKSFHLEL